MRRFQLLLRVPTQASHSSAISSCRIQVCVKALRPKPFRADFSSWCMGPEFIRWMMEL